MERKIIDWLQQNFSADPPVTVGIGDDGAVLEMDRAQLVVTTDAVIDGVHFDLRRHNWREVGCKAVAVNLSDLAAMGAEPIAIVVTLVLPHGTKLSQVKNLYSGICTFCSKWPYSIAGGDTNFASGPLMVSITAMGRLALNRQPWLCRGAQVGDEILVSGSFGGSILGRHMAFEPRCDLAAAIGSSFQIHAATDVSDGLVFNLGVIARASACRAILDLDAIPIAPGAKKMGDKHSPLHHALYDGEDYELIVVTSPAQSKKIMSDKWLAEQLTRVGVITSGTGIIGRRAGHPDKRLPIRGYTHR